MTTADLAELKDVYAGTGPFATVYLDASRNTETGAHEIELRWRALHERLGEQGAPEDLLTAIGEVITADRAPGRHGLVVVGGQGAVRFSAVTADPPPRDHAAWAPLPHLMPYVAQLASHPSYAVVVTDHAGADISIDPSGVPDGSESTDTVAGSTRHPLHKVGDNNWSELHFQHRVENAWEANARDVADAVHKHVAQAHPEVVVVAGEQQARAVLMSQLDSLGGVSVVQVEAGGRADGSSEDALHDAVRDAVLHHVWRTRRELLERMQQNVGRGEFAATGVQGVIDALRQAQVDTLIVSDDPSSTLTAWFGDGPTEFGSTQDEVAALGVTDARQDRLDAVLLRAAVGTGAKVVVTPDAHQYVPEGIGALLRY